MKKLLILITFICITCFVNAQTFEFKSSSTTNTNVRYQEGYYKPSTGTYVQGHYKTETNKTNHDNFSTKGNYNTYTGTNGTVPRDYSYEAKSYSSDKNIQTGPRGGQYYINSNGNKTYVPKH